MPEPKQRTYSLTIKCDGCGLPQAQCCCGDDADREMGIENAEDWGDEPFGNR